MGDLVVDNKRQRKLFRTREEAETFELGSTAKTAPYNIQTVFKHGCDLFWRGTRNEKDAVRHTNFLISHFGAKEQVSTITSADIQDMVFELRDEVGNSPATINRKLSALSKLLTHARKRGAIEAVPDIDFLKEGKGRLRFLTKDEEQAMFEPMCDSHRMFATFLLYTGCRVGEAMKLRWSDIIGQQVTFYATKNDRDRTIPLGNRAQASLQYTKGEGWSSPFSRINYDAFHAGWNRAKAKAGLSDDRQVVPHVLRHTCASRMVQGNGKASVDLYRVKEWLGHSSIAVTERYAHLRPSDLTDALSVLED